MGVIDDMLKALDRIPVWKRLQEIPDEIDELNARVADLETKLGGKWPPDVCRFCGERASRLSHCLGPSDKGILEERWRCEICDKTDARLVKAK